MLVRYCTLKYPKLLRLTDKIQIALSTTLKTD